MIKNPIHLLAVLVLSVMLCQCNSRTPGDATTEVNPFIGTGAHGHTFPGATVPFGMVHMTPVNGRSGWDWTSGYHYSDSVIAGFAHTSFSGTGVGDLNDILITPVSGEPDLAVAISDFTKAPYASTFSHREEEAEPGYYRVYLEEHGVMAELTATERVGMQRYRFDSDERPGVVIDLGFAINWDWPKESMIILGDSSVSGYRISSGWAKHQPVYFHTKFSQPIASHRFYRDSVRVSATGDTLRHPKARVYLQFGEQKGGQLLVKTALSAVDGDGAQKNMAAELNHWNFDRVRESARAQWQEELRDIRIEGGTPTQRETFYTALYHTKITPMLFEDVDGRYFTADYSIGSAPNRTHYTLFSLWDTFRAAHPLYTITEHQRVDDYIRSMLDFYDHHGLLPVWNFWGNETNTMTGYHSVSVIAEAYRKGFHGFDAEKAMAAMVKSAEQGKEYMQRYESLGYLPADEVGESVTKTLEYSYDDWCIAEMARLMGKQELADRFYRRSRFYRNLFDRTTGFMRGKDAAGKWVTPFDPKETSHHGGTALFTEGNAWQFSWFVPHDPADLITLMGGEKPFVAKLDQLFSESSELKGEHVPPDVSGLIGQYAHGNEPSHHIPYLYSYAGAPSKTAKKVRQILDELYSNQPDGISGNEDQGQMSAWYIFSSLGFYPVNPASGQYVLGTPLFDRAEVALPDGKSFEIRALRSDSSDIFIQSVSLNGHILDKSFITHRQLMAGGVLEITLGSEPHPSWGVAEEWRPGQDASVQ